MEILYCKNYPDGYNKISAIKPDGWEWTTIERDEKLFGILKVKDGEKELIDAKVFPEGLTPKVLKEHYDENIVCLDVKAEKLTATPVNFKYPKPVEMKSVDKNGKELPDTKELLKDNPV